MVNCPDFFWLHVKKSAGIMLRNALTPHYVEVERVMGAPNFLQADVSEYNDILNNYRTLLGDYQFRRSLFAKTYLYPECWSHMMKFAVSREPIDRAISAFFWFHNRDQKSRFFQGGRHVLRMARSRKLQNRMHYDFDHYLERIEYGFSIAPRCRYGDLEFATHVAKIYDDVTDETGEILLDHIVRIEELNGFLAYLFNALDLDTTSLTEDHLNKLRYKRARQNHKQPISLTGRQKAKLEELYAEDFEIYHDKCSRF